jgi:aminodeoxyfutalosine deaminase
VAEPLTTIYVAGAVRDAAPPPEGPVNLRPGAVAVREGRIVAVGEPDAVLREAKHRGPFARVDLPDHLILPAMVNAHAHLDLTDFGPVPYDPAGGFVGWVEMVMRRRPQTEEGITNAVRNGLQLSHAAGTWIIGDIAGSDTAVIARINARQLWLDGPSYLECFGLGSRADAAAGEAQRRLERLTKRAAEARTLKALWVGLQPHAPYSAGLPLYAAADRFLASTHLAETREEERFIRDAEGPFVDLLRRIGKWDGTFVATGKSPVAHVAPIMKQARWVVAHCNYVTDDDIHLLRDAGASVGFCPIASAYFGHVGHRYRDMLDAGVNVCLGTDSIICQPSDEPQPLGILAQARMLYRRDRASPQKLLEMATWRGLKALGLGQLNPGLSPGAAARFASVRFDPSDPTDALTQVLLNDYPVEPLTL